MAQSEAAIIASDAGSISESEQRIVPDGASNDRGYVYCIAEYDEDGKETGYFKIGTAYDPEKRLRDLQTGNAHPLKIWRDCKVEVLQRLDAEKAAKQAVEEYKVSLGGGTEWFKVPENKQQKLYDLFYKATEQYLVKK